MICPIASWMKSNDCNQQALAEKLDAPKSSVSAYIAGKRGFRFARFLRLAEITGLPVVDLMRWTAKPAPPKKSRGRRRTA